MSKSILVFSYYANMPGSCQAEWIDDRMFAFIEKGYDITLISATCCFTHTNSKIKHIKVPALSPHGGSFEYEEIGRRNIPHPNAIVFFYLKCMHQINRILKTLHLNSGEGRWTWFISSTFACIKIGSVKNFDFVFTTGGPASGHLTGILMAKLFGKKVMVEFQDPLSGKDIGRNKLSHAGLQFFEKRIIRYADITLYCTRSAMEFARKKYSEYSDKIFFVYPGSNKQVHSLSITSNKEQKNSRDTKVNITYLGSLYQTRNLDAMMQSIIELSREGFSMVEMLEINIYGNMNPDIRQRILDFPLPMIKIHGLVNRDIALLKGFEADVLLLIQNTDDRSIGTIPFKTYDYLHTGKLILALTYKNPELDEMMLSHGHLVCQANDVPTIKKILKGLLADPDKHYRVIKPSDLTPELAVEQMLNLLHY